MTDALFSFMAGSVLLSALLIFALRVADMTLDTMRMLYVMRGHKLLAWVLGFVQSVIYVVAISAVLANLDNWLNIIGYAAGFATGNVMGMFVEGRLAIGHTQLTVISSMRGTAVAEKLRGVGYAVTEIPARGKDGTVSVLHVSVQRKDLPHVEAVIQEADPAAFVSAEDMRPLRRGFFRA